MFGKKVAAPLPRATVNPSPPVQLPSNVAPQQSQKQAPSDARVAIQSQQVRSSSLLKAFAEDLKRNGTSFVKLNEMGVSEANRDPERSAVCFLVALNLKPGDQLALRNLDWVAGRGRGVNVDEIRAACGFSTTSALAPTSFPFPTLGSPPTITEENKRKAQALYQQAHEGILGSPVQRELYFKALGVDPNLRLAWSELSLVAAAAGDYDLADKCKDATRVFDASKFLKDFRDVLGTVVTSGAGPKPEIKPGVTYLYILQKSSAPSDYVLNEVLAFWKGQRGSNFAMLGGMSATSIPETADTYVMGILFAICDRYGFDRQPDKLGYSTLKAGGEKIGVCRFIN
jgi:hypothetical protein